jgi:NAD(P)-dependent dehydrogenase (short-subunit alcohol dehydrogenase family)
VVDWQRSAFITGGAHGLGLEAADRLAAQQFGLSITAHSATAAAAAARQLRARHGCDVVGIGVDELDPNSLATAADDHLHRFGGINVVVLTGEVISRTTTTSPRATTWEVVFGVNARAPFLLLQRFLPALEWAGSTVPGSAHIVAPGIWPEEFTGGLDHAVYRASKAALSSLLASIATARSGIAVTEISPVDGLTDLIDHLCTSGPAPAGHPVPITAAS